jgi:uncharacterized protein with HEPN domain
MEIEIASCLVDINQAIKEINEFLPDNKDFFEFKKDTKTKRAVERNIEIIGEAVRKITELQPDINISSSKKIIGLRNIISHAYDSIEPALIWGIIQKDIPTLSIEIEELKKA